MMKELSSNVIHKTLGSASEAMELLSSVTAANIFKEKQIKERLQLINEELT